MIANRYIFIFVIALLASVSIAVRGVPLRPKTVTWMLVDTSFIYGQSWYSLTPAKDELWIKRCGMGSRKAQPYERFVIAEE